MATTHKNSARSTLAEMARKAYAAHWARVRIGMGEGAEPKELERHERAAWESAVEAVIRGMT